MVQRDVTKIQGPADKHQLSGRQFVIDKANSIAPIDGVYQVIRYNIRQYTWGGAPYPSRIEFEELTHIWDDDWLASAIERAEALHRDTPRIGEIYRSKNFERESCQIVVSEFSALYPEFSSETIDQVITDGCIMAR